MKNMDLENTEQHPVWCFKPYLHKHNDVRVEAKETQTTALLKESAEQK